MKLIPMTDFVLQLEQDVTVNGVNYIMCRKYARFLKRKPVKEDLFGKNRFFVEEPVYVDLQPSTEWNYYTLKGKRIFTASNTQPRPLDDYNFNFKVEDLCGLDLTLTPHAKTLIG